jgi:hypothetical protein
MMGIETMPANTMSSDDTSMVVARLELKPTRRRRGAL